MSRLGYGAGSITKRADGRYMIRKPLGRNAEGVRQPKYAYAKTEAAALAILRDLTADQARGQILTSTSPTLAEFLADWFATGGPRKGKRWRPRTRDSYRHAIDAHIVPALGHHTITKLAPVHVQKWLNRQQDEQGDVPRHIGLAHATLRAALSWAVTPLRLVAFNAAKGLHAAPKPTKPMVVWTPEQGQRFLDACERDRLGALYIVALACGLRRGEALGLAWHAPGRPGICLATGTVDIVQQLSRVGTGRLELQPLKTEKSRRQLELPGFALGACRARWTAQKEERLKAGPGWVDTGLAFTTTRVRGTRERAGKPIDPRNMARHMDALLVRAGVPRLTPHGLRHSAVSLLMAKGVPIEQISQLLGHSSIKLTVDTYGHLLPQTTARAAAHMDAIFTGGR